MHPAERTHAAMSLGYEILAPRFTDDSLEEPARHLVLQQPRPVPGERRLADGPDSDVPVEGSPEEHVVAQPLTRTGAQRVSSSSRSQGRLHHVFGWDRRPAPLAICASEVG